MASQQQLAAETRASVTDQSELTRSACCFSLIQFSGELNRWRAYVLQAPVDGEVRGSPVGQEQLERVPEQEGQARSV